MGLQEELLAEGLCVEEKEQLRREFQKLNKERAELANEQKKLVALSLKLNKEVCVMLLL